MPKTMVLLDFKPFYKYTKNTNLCN